MTLHYELFVFPCDGGWQVEVEDESAQRECMRTFKEQAAAIRHGRRLMELFHESGGSAHLHLSEDDGLPCVLSGSRALVIH